MQQGTGRHELGTSRNKQDLARDRKVSRVLQGTSGGRVLQCIGQVRAGARE